jgi:DNA-binding transcriptional LysR family regulator
MVRFLWRKNILSTGTGSVNQRREMHEVGDMEVFVRVIERASFSGAADALGVTPSAVSKHVTRLEDRLGVRLLHRTTRRLSLTPEGEIYHARVRDILAAFAEAEGEVAHRGVEPQGLLRINSVAPFAFHCLSDALPEFMALYPKVEVALAVTDHIVDLIEEGADLGLRTGRIDDASLVRRPICTVERGIYAAPAYVERRGLPASPEELKEHDCIGLSSTPAWEQWPFDIGGERRVVEVRSRLSVDNAMMALQLAIGGAGIARTSNLTVGRAATDGRLVQLFRDSHVTEATPLSAVYPIGRHRMLKVRVFIDFLVARYRHPPWQVTDERSVFDAAACGAVVR